MPEAPNFSPAQVQVEEHFLCQMRGALSFGSAALDTETAQIHSIGGLTTTGRTQLRSLGLQRIRSRMTLRQRGQFATITCRLFEGHGLGHGRPDLLVSVFEPNLK